jgi:citrate synthase
MILKDKIEERLPAMRERVHKLVTENGDVKVGDVTVAQVYGGMRGVRGLVTDISYVDPMEGIRLRGHILADLLKELPKPQGAEMPLVGGLYYLLLVGDIPNFEQAMEVEDEWKQRYGVPGYVYDVLKAMPRDTHPMTLFSQGVLAMQHESIFAKRYQEGMQKDEYWEPMLEDSLTMTARLPALAAFIYSLKYKDGSIPAPDQDLDYGANFAHMLGIEKKGYDELARLYLIIHSDHESGNVSAHATHLVASALSDIYYATSAALDGLAGPLHGLANQEALGWLLEVYNKFGGVPTKEQLSKFAHETLNSGQVIPGYGHAVLRRTDPRYSAQFEFAKKHMPEDDIFKLASLVYEVVPGVLKEQGKAKNPWPNVDAISGTLQYHYGVKEFDFYTVMFGVSRALGVSANAVWARAIGQPIERPKSLTTKMIEETVAEQKQPA